MYNKKAVSDVVSTVLIILLVVAAIAIIGAIVLNTVNKGGVNVNTAIACQSLDIKATQCGKNGVGLANATATAIRGAGGSDLDVTGLTFIFTKADGSTLTNSSLSTTNVIGVGNVGESVTALNVSGGPFTKVKTASIIRLADGSNATCESMTEVPCV